MTVAHEHPSTDLRGIARRRRRWPRRVLAILLTLLIVGWLGLNALVASSITQVRNLAMRENGDDITRLPAPTSLACCSAFRSVTYGPKLTGWYARGKAKAPTILLVHGYASNLVSTSSLGGALHEEGYSVLAINLGFVTAAHDYSGGSLEAQDVDHAVRWLRSRSRAPIVLWGFSAGGHASLLAAVSETRVDAVVSEGAPVNPGQEMYDAVVDRLRVPGFVMPRAVFDGFFWIFARRTPVDLSGVLEHEERRVPTLIIHGQADDAVPPDNGKLLAERTGGDLWLIPNVGHVEGFERLGRDYLRRTLKFVSRALTRG